ncbi:ATP-dependent DNA helicase RecQ-like [Ostrea edulis]|uniref:ATP-dependent DNA helicase RecQ-like n=1 Tax=Ostrea edulis TaxID=37623 RepID=UPI0024AFA6EA|nr:ATP-dependent DNA helicase RecQ-like [Ostrea edulis]
MADIERVVEEVLKKFGVKCLKDEQRMILDCVLDKKDCVAVLPTGFGKSLPFQAYLPVKRALLRDDSFGKVIVCCPLVSLMQDQVRKLTSIGLVTAAFKGTDKETDELIQAGKVDIIYASPESLVGDSQWRSTIQRLNVTVIVVDEFHTVVTWGGLEADKEDKVFRKWFRRVGEIRSYFPEASLLALSATCTKTIKKRVIEVLGLKDYTNITVSPNKENIKYIVKKVDPNIESSLLWILDSFRDLKKEFPRTIFYCNSIIDVGRVYNFIVSELSDVTNIENMVEMFHSETTEDKKKKTLEKLTEDSVLRIIVATSALGMGVNVYACHNVIIYGPPRCLIDFVQETGRVGRDGEQSCAFLMYYGQQLRNVDQDVKDFLTSTDCRRLQLLKTFLSESELKLVQGTRIHTCCDICDTGCSCNSCSSTILEKYMTNLSLDDVHVMETSSSDSDTVSYEYESDEDLDEIKST